jgi:hypothetical protein
VHVKPERAASALFAPIELECAAPLSGVDATVGAGAPPAPMSDALAASPASQPISRAASIAASSHPSVGPLSSSPRPPALVLPVGGVAPLRSLAVSSAHAGRLTVERVELVGFEMTKIVVAYAMSPYRIEVVERIARICTDIE